MRRVGAILFGALLAGPAMFAAGHEAGGDHVIYWNLANFAILAGGAGYFIYKKGGAFFAGRTEALRRDLEEAARLNREALARFKDAEQRLAQLGADIEALKAKAREESAAESERVRAEMARDFERVRQQAEQEIAAAGKAARQELRSFAADLAINAAENRIKERMTPDSEAALMSGMLKDLEKRSETGAVAS